MRVDFLCFFFLWRERKGREGATDQSAKGGRDKEGRKQRIKGVAERG